MGDSAKPTCAQRLSAVGRFLYNKEEGTVLGRTGKSWGLIIGFYIVYYACLAGFFVGMLSVLLFGIIDDSQPFRTGDQSLLRMNPGLGFRPMPLPESTLVKVNLSNADTYKTMVADLDKLWNDYSSVNKSHESKDMEYADCDLTNAQANSNFDPKKKICRLNPATAWGNCTSANKFGYATEQPCIVVKMNRLFGWLPDIENSAWSNHTLMTCGPENDGDRATFGGQDSIVYSPGVILNGTRYGYFSSALFPFLNQPGYTTPAVAVQFPNARRNVMIMVECRLHNLKNAVYDKVDRQAMVRFELLFMKDK